MRVVEEVEACDRGDATTVESPPVASTFTGPKIVAPLRR
jgi:hypothetical protein